MGKWRLENKDKLIEKVTCECGGCFQYQSKWRHLNKLKHINYLNKLEN